jgi:hypothetical protein
MHKDWLKDLARLYLPVYKYESDIMNIAYAGYSSIKKNYYVRFILDINTHHTFLGRRWFWQMPDLIKSDHINMVISEISPIVLNYFQKCNGYIVPGWVPMRINIDRPMSEIYHSRESHYSGIIRRIRKFNLTYEILTDKESYDNFVNNFYLPYITSRYGEEALIEDLNIYMNLKPAPVLIAIKECEVMVGAAVMRKSGESLDLMRLGLLDGKEEYRLHGVIGAIYYFSILEGQKMGCRYMDVSGTRPFLTDGLTKFKIGLGAEFAPNHSQGKEYLWMGVNEHSIVAEEFMRRNPVIYINKDFSFDKSEHKSTTS